MYFYYIYKTWPVHASFIIFHQHRNLFWFFKILIRYWDTGLQSCARKILGVARKRWVPAENTPMGAQKGLICLKQRDWSKRWAPTISTRCPDQLSRQFLTTASILPYSSKNSSAEHIHAVLYKSLCALVWMRQCVCVYVWVCVVCLCEWVCFSWWAMLIKREYVRLRNECVCVCVYVSECVFVYVSEWVVCDDEPCW